ncbi:hypothetical protein DFJ77DRAFT_473227 [Powellomyces hirtus]|nr:hypothetical protein DFJ77DRAFT_473227 [Powellomyces hirtus]
MGETAVPTRRSPEPTWGTGLCDALSWIQNCSDTEQMRTAKIAHTVLAAVAAVNYVVVLLRYKDKIKGPLRIRMVGDLFHACMSAACHLSVIYVDEIWKMRVHMVMFYSVLLIAAHTISTSRACAELVPAVPWNDDSAIPFWTRQALRLSRSHRAQMLLYMFRTGIGFILTVIATHHFTTLSIYVWWFRATLVWNLLAIWLFDALLLALLSSQLKTVMTEYFDNEKTAGKSRQMMSGVGTASWKAGAGGGGEGGGGEMVGDANEPASVAEFRKTGGRILFVFQSTMQKCVMNVLGAVYLVVVAESMIRQAKWRISFWIILDYVLGIDFVIQVLVLWRSIKSRGIDDTFLEFRPISSEEVSTALVVFRKLSSIGGKIIRKGSAVAHSTSLASIGSILKPSPTIIKFAEMNKLDERGEEEEKLKNQPADGSAGGQNSLPPPPRLGQRTGSVTSFTDSTRRLSPAKHKHRPSLPNIRKLKTAHPALPPPPPSPGPDTQTHRGFDNVGLDDIT